MTMLTTQLSAAHWDELRAAGHLDTSPDAAVTAAEQVLRDAARRDVARRRARRRRRSALLAVAAGALAVVVAPTFSVGGRPAASAEAAAFLREVAIVAAGGPDLGADVNYWYVHWQYQHPGQQPVVRQDWQGRVESNRIIDPGQDWDFRTGEPGLWSYGDVRCDWECIRALPEDSDALGQELRSALERQGNPDPDTQLFACVGDLLRFSPATPAVRAALYQVMATVPGVTLNGEATDATGRPAVLVERRQSPDSGPHSYVVGYLIDPGTGALLEERSNGYVATYFVQGGVPDDVTTLD